MASLSVEIRDPQKENVDNLRKEGFLPGVVYGPEMETLSLKFDYKDFEEIYREAGETSLVTLNIKGKKEDIPILIHDFQKDPVTGNFLHVDFYRPSLKEKTEASVPLEFVGESEAIEKLEGTLVKDITEVEVKALPHELPDKIKVDIKSLKTFEDKIKISDLKTPPEVEILEGPEEIVASVVPPTKVEEELEKPPEEIEEEEIEKVGEEEEAPEVVEEGKEAPPEEAPKKEEKEESESEEKKS